MEWPMKLTPRPIALLWRKLWSVFALDAMEPVLDSIVSTDDGDLGLGSSRRYRSHDHFSTDLSAKDGENVVPVVLLQPRER